MPSLLQGWKGLLTFPILAACRSRVMAGASGEKRIDGSDPESPRAGPTNERAPIYEGSCKTPRITVSPSHKRRRNRLRAVLDGHFRLGSARPVGRARRCDTPTRARRTMA